MCIYINVYYTCFDKVKSDGQYKLPTRSVVRMGTTPSCVVKNYLETLQIIPFLKLSQYAVKLSLFISLAQSHARLR